MWLSPNPGIPRSRAAPPGSPICPWDSPAPHTRAGFPGPSSKPGLSPASGRAGSRPAAEAERSWCLCGLLRPPHAPPPTALLPLIHPLSPCWAPGPQPRPTPLLGQQVSEAGTRTPRPASGARGRARCSEGPAPQLEPPPVHPRHLLTPQPLLLPAQPPLLQPHSLPLTRSRDPHKGHPPPTATGAQPSANQTLSPPRRAVPVLPRRHPWFLEIVSTGCRAFQGSVIRGN